MKNKILIKGRKITALLLCLTCIFSLVAFSGCGKSKKATLTINNVPIGEDVFTYFLDMATAELTPDADQKVLKEKAVALTTRYFKTNSLAKANRLVIPSYEKVKISEKVNAYWTVYGDYYSEIGITRETLTKVFTSEAYRDALMLFYYGKGGSKEIPDSRLYANFKANYILFKSITGYLWEADENGVSKPISKNDMETLVLKFQNMADMVNSGEQTMEQAADYLVSTGYPASVQTVILNRDDTSFPAGFFDKVYSMKPNHAKNIASNEYIFLVLRADPGIDSTYYQSKKPELLKAVVGDDIDKIIDKAYKTKSSLIEKNLNNYLTIIKNKKSDNNEPST